MMMFPSRRNASIGAARTSGFTMIELMIAVAVAAILAAIALPTYASYVASSRAKGAASDLVALGLVYENDFQKTLVYPTYAAGTTIAASSANRTGTQATDFANWAPAEGSYYTYTTSSSATAYTLTATAITGNCVLTLNNSNTRTATGSSCGFTSW